MLFLLIPYLSYVDPVEFSHFLFGFLVVQPVNLCHGAAKLVVVHQHPIVQVQGNSFRCQRIKDLRLVLHTVLHHHVDAVDLLSCLVLLADRPLHLDVLLLGTVHLQLLDVLLQVRVQNAVDGVGRVPVQIHQYVEVPFWR